ncbi:MAG TPA: response regulator [Trichocoleus sp.]
MLVVDGDADSRDFLIMLLEEYEVEAIGATCVSESLEIMQQDCPDLLISEIVLPGEDGYSLIRQVKAFELAYNVQIPAIAVTACVSKVSQIQALTAGFCKYLPKPLDIDRFISTVACVTEQIQGIALSACQ